MKEREARTIANEFAAEIGLPVRAGSVFVVAADGGYRLLVSADERWFAKNSNFPREFKGLHVDVTDRIVGFANSKLKIYA